MELSRRALIKVLGIAPASAHIVGQHLSMIASSGAGLLGQGQSEAPCVASDSGSENFTSAISWWRKHGEKEIRESARSIDGFDADIVSMHLPLQFKVAMQRERNFVRLKASRWIEVENILKRNGVFKWWP